MRKILGLVLAGLLLLAKPLSAASVESSNNDAAPSVLYGNYSGTIVPIQVTSAGAVVTTGGTGGTTSGAYVDATYITQTADGTLTHEQALSGLTTGLAIVTNGTGVISTTTNNSTNWNTAYTDRIESATGTAPLTLGIAANALTGSMTQATSAADGYVTSADWNAFNGKQAAGSDLTAVTADAPLSGSGTAGSHLIFTNPGYITSESAFNSWLAGPPLVSTFTNDAGYLTAITGALSLNQTTPQTVTSGTPIFNEGLNVTAGSSYNYAGNPAIISAGTGNFDFFFGGAGNTTETGYSNVGAGQATLASLTSGTGNAAFGSGALNTNDVGNQNSALGEAALASNQSGSGNSALGNGALHENIIGSTNSALGFQALYWSNSDNNTGVGWDALFNQTTGANNTAIGWLAGEGSLNQSLGYSSYIDNNMTFIGALASRGPGVTSATVLDRATAIGYNAKVSASNMMALGGIGTDAVHVCIGVTSSPYTLDVLGNSRIGTTSSAWIFDEETIAGLGQVATFSPLSDIGSGSLTPIGAISANVLIFKNVTSGTNPQFIFSDTALTNNMIIDYNATTGVLGFIGNTTSATLQPEGYLSSDGTAGITSDAVVMIDLTTSATMHFKNGLFTGMN